MDLSIFSNYTSGVIIVFLNIIYYFFKKKLKKYRARYVIEWIKLFKIPSL
jgi:hypothetical protein